MAIRDLVVTSIGSGVRCQPADKQPYCRIQRPANAKWATGATGREGQSVSDGVDAPLDNEWIGFAHDVGILVLVVKP